jgi:hypothetical protein
MLACEADRTSRKCEEKTISETAVCGRKGQTNNENVLKRKRLGLMGLTSQEKGP